VSLIKLKQPSARLKQVRNKVLALMKIEMAEVPAEEILAMMAYTLGQLVAMQDQRKMTPKQAMEIVAMNIEEGNKQAIEEAFRGGVWT
jgi:hypothetical protein